MIVQFLHCPIATTALTLSYCNYYAALKLSYCNDHATLTLSYFSKCASITLSYCMQLYQLVFAIEANLTLNYINNAAINGDYTTSCDNKHILFVLL